METQQSKSFSFNLLLSPESLLPLVSLLFYWDMSKSVATSFELISFIVDDMSADLDVADELAVIELAG